MDANKITRLMGLTIMQANKNFKSNRMLKIFGRSNDISRIGDIHETTGDEWILGKCEKFIRSGIHIAKNCKAVGTKYSRNIRENFEVSCNNKIDWV